MKLSFRKLTNWLEKPIEESIREKFRILLALCLIMKTYSSFPLFDNESLLQSLSLLIGFCSGFMILFGKQVRACAFVAATACLFLFFNPPSADWLSHNNQLLFFCLMAFSLDSWFPGLRFLQALIFIIYICAVVTKIDTSFLSGLYLQQLYMLGYASSDLSAVERFFPLFKIAAIASLIIEALIPVCLIFKQTRRLAVITGILFHLGLSLILPVSVFSLLMSAILVLFWESRSDLSR